MKDEGERKRRRIIRASDHDASLTLVKGKKEGKRIV